MKDSRKLSRYKPTMDGPYEYHLPPVKMSCWKRSKTFLWNSQTGQFFGRTACSWVKILFFYLCFYVVLIVFCAASFALFYLTLDMKEPKWQLDGSIIGTSPGLALRPLPWNTQEPSDHILIKFKRTGSTNLQGWVEKLDKFLDPYEKRTLGRNVVTCDYNSPPKEGQACFVDVKEFFPCTKENNYGYPKGNPCIFLKLNKIFNWLPDYYTSQNLSDEMPQDLKDHIASNPNSVNTVWISCKGKGPADVKNIGAIKYFPNRGFPGYFYPYKNQDSYLSPLVAVQFEILTPDVVVNIECKAWTRNIIYNDYKKHSPIHFQLKME